MNTTKEQREDLVRLLAEASEKEPLEQDDISFPGCSTSWAKTQRALIFTALPALPALLADAERCAELEAENEQFVALRGELEMLSSLEIRADAAEAERDELRRKLDVAVKALEDIKTYSECDSFDIAHAALAAICGEAPRC